MIEELKSGNKEGQVLQELLNRTKESDNAGHNIPDLQPVDLKDMIENLKSGNEEGLVLQEFLNQTNRADIPEHKIPHLWLVDHKDMIEKFKSGNEEGQVLQEFLNRTKESDIPGHKIPDLQLVDLKDVIEDLKSGNEEGQACWRYFKFFKAITSLVASVKCLIISEYVLGKWTVMKTLQAVLDIVQDQFSCVSQLVIIWSLHFIRILELN